MGNIHVVNPDGADERADFIDDLDKLWADHPGLTNALFVGAIALGALGAMFGSKVFGRRKTHVDFDGREFQADGRWRVETMTFRKVG